jgi:hypothetical protein
VKKKQINISIFITIFICFFIGKVRLMGCSNFLAINMTPQCGFNCSNAEHLKPHALFEKEQISFFIFNCSLFIEEKPPAPFEKWGK